MRISDWSSDVCSSDLWINALLSGPKTHAVNIASNVLTSLWTLPEQAIASGIGAVSRSPHRVLLRDAAARAMGMMQGAREGLKLARRAFVSGEALDARSKLDAATYRATTGTVSGIIRLPAPAPTAYEAFYRDEKQQ